MKWTLEPASSFETYRVTWQRLNQANADTPLLDTMFVAPLLREFGKGDELLALGGSPTDPEVMMLLTRTSLGQWETFQPSQAPLGLVVNAPNLQVADILPDLLHALPGFALAVGITQQDPDLSPRPADRGRLRTLDYIDTARVLVKDDFDSYWQTCDKKMRKNVQWRRNRLAKQNIQPRLEILTEPQQMPTGVEDFGNLETSGWKGKEGTAVHAQNAQGRYYHEIMKAFSESGEARIYNYWLDDKLAASDLCLHRNGTIVVLKITYDDTQRTHAPNVLMREEEFRDIFAAKLFRTVEFYGRVKDWHTKWSIATRTLYHLTYYRSRALLGAKNLVKKLTRPKIDE